MARTLALCTTPASCRPELRLWLRQPSVLAWLIKNLSHQLAPEEAAGNVALCLGNLTADTIATDSESILQDLREAGAVKALVGEVTTNLNPSLPWSS